MNLRGLSINDKNVIPYNADGSYDNGHSHGHIKAAIRQFSGDMDGARFGFGMTAASSTSSPDHQTIASSGVFDIHNIYTRHASDAHAPTNELGLRHIRFKLVLDGIDADAMSALASDLYAYNKQIKDQSLVDAEQIGHQYFQIIQSHAMALASGQTRLVIAFPKIATDRGNAHARIRVSLTPALPARAQGDKPPLARLLQRAALHAKGTASDGLLQYMLARSPHPSRTTRILNQWQRAHLVTYHDQTYRTSLGLNAYAMTINGQTMPPKVRKAMIGNFVKGFMASAARAQDAIPAH